MMGGDPEAERLRRVLKALVDRLDEIVASPDYNSVWVLAHVHGFVYRGPNWVDVMKAARAALQEGDTGDRAGGVGEAAAGLPDGARFGPR
jgi:hypothetical protein